MKSKSSLITVIILVVAVTMVAGIAWLTRAKSEPTAAAPSGTVDPPGVFADKLVTDCWDVELPPPGAEINTVLDSLSKKLRISFLDPRLGKDRVIYISYEEPACQENPELKRVVTDALKVHAQNMAESCRSMAEIVRSGKPEVGPPGRPKERINLEAAKKYLERWCK